ncbi:hypothetical protein [Maribacter dokdonensis]|uniref:hypothetical protein n=1 Tax=Maribacter dokdonensis TaxID=320912 RepID=UPI002AB1A079|nr:hypothetical protein [Maribacter dokdonensis]
MNKKNHSLLKKGIYIYFLLLIFEGALRKWFLPSLATPLLVVRDPIAIILIVMAWKNNLFKVNIYLVAVFTAAILSFIATLLVGHANITVATFGLRILIIHFPLIFIIGSIFDYDDVIKLGKVVLAISIPMTLLIAIQFYSPQSALVNRGIGGDIEGAGFDGAMGFYRPPGTFSFTNGTTLFYSLSACFVFFFWLSKEKINLLLLITATFSLLVSIPVAMSRGLLFGVAITAIFVFFTLIKSPKFLSKIVSITFISLIIIAILSQTYFFEKATEAFTSRFDSASKVEGGLQGTLIGRYFGDLIGAFTDNHNLPFFGNGLGLGTNAGSQIITGDRSFLIAEGEWGRLIGEMGILLGSIIIVTRLSICIKLFIHSFRAIGNNNILPWILLSFGLLSIPQGQWAQPTALGFSTVIGGLIIAGLRNFKKHI